LRFSPPNRLVASIAFFTCAAARTKTSTLGLFHRLKTHGVTKSVGEPEKREIGVLMAN
jgi:hypothetical protein